MAGLARTLLLSELRLREPSGSAAQRRGHSGVRLGARHPVHRMDHHSLLVDQPLLRPVAVPVPHARSTARARPSPSHRTTCGGELLPAVPAWLQLRAAGQRRHSRDVLRRAHQLRQTLQPGAVAAYRAAGDSVGSVPPPAAARPALAAARLVAADLSVGVDHLSASLHRYPYRRAARPALPVAVAARRRQSTAQRTDYP